MFMYYIYEMHLLFPVCPLARADRTAPTRLRCYSFSNEVIENEAQQGR